MTNKLAIFPKGLKYFPIESSLSEHEIKRLYRADQSARGENPPSIRDFPTLFTILDSFFFAIRKSESAVEPKQRRPK